MTDQNKHHVRRNVEDYSEVMKNEKSTNNFFRTFISKPKNIHLDIQNKDEKIILVLRQHLITQLKSFLFLCMIILLIPILLNFSGFIETFPDKFIGAFYIFWIVLTFGLFTRTFLIWFFNVYIITDERIIDVDFASMIYHNISYAKIENIEDVTARTTGPLAAIFNYGTILIQTAGEKTEFEFGNVPQPAKVTKLISELLLEEEKEKIEGRVN
ncbi:PH domain-containing protein [Patescibacteria group bacterium]|nr:PH domain-containing protein [Patescibacteria group bacterium]